MVFVSFNFLSAFACPLKSVSNNRDNETNPKTLRVSKVDFFTNVLLSLPVLLHRAAACVFNPAASANS